MPCGSVLLGLNEPSRALLDRGGDPAGSGRVAKGECRLSAPGQPDLGEHPRSAIRRPRGLSDGNGFALTATTDAAQLLSPGPNTFRILCNQTGGDVAFSTTLSVVALGGTAG